MFISIDFIERLSLYHDINNGSMNDCCGYEHSLNNCQTNLNKKIEDSIRSIPAATRIQIPLAIDHVRAHAIDLDHALRLDKFAAVSGVCLTKERIRRL